MVHKVVMRKVLRTFFVGLVLLAALGAAQTASAHEANVASSMPAFDSDANAPDTAASASFGLPATASSCPCGDCHCACCMVSCMSGSGCTGHAALPGAVGNVDHGRAVVQYVWSSPSLSFLVPADTEPPRTAV